MSECTMFQIGPRDDTSNRWDVRDLAYDVKLDNDKDFSAGTLTFKLLEVNEGFVPNDGDTVQFAWDGKPTFFGHIFKVEYDSDEVFLCTAYDNRRYLKNQDSRIWPIGTLSQRFQTACSYVGIKFKVAEGASYKLPAKVSDGVSFYDMLKEDATATLNGTGTEYIITDGYGQAVLHKMPWKNLSTLVGDDEGQILTAWSYDRSIDEAANIIKVVKSSQKDKQTTTATAKGDSKVKGASGSSKKAPKKTKAEKAAEKKQKAEAKKQKEANKTANEKAQAERESVYGSAGSDPNNTILTSAVAKGSNVNDWGGLQEVVKVSNDKLNQAQMQAQADGVLKQKNREKKTMKLTTLGSLDFEVGVSFTIQIQSLADIGISNQLVTVTKCTQNFSRTDWTTDMEVVMDG